MASRNHIKTLIDRLAKRQRDWLRRNADHIQDREAKYLKEDLRQPSFKPLANIGASLGMLGLCYGARGETLLYDGADSGWSETHKSVLYHYWGLRCRVLWFEEFSGSRS